MTTIGPSNEILPEPGVTSLTARALSPLVTGKCRGGEGVQTPATALGVFVPIPPGVSLRGVATGTRTETDVRDNMRVKVVGKVVVPLAEWPS